MPLDSQNPKDFVTIVSGLPRSGTSMLMRMLSAGGMPVRKDEIRAADEDNLQGYYELEATKSLERDSAWVASCLGRVVKVISFLLPFLPNMFAYKILFMRRHLQEVLASQRAMLLRRGESVAVSDEQMARIFTTHLEEVTEWMRSQANIDVLEVDYNDVMLDSTRTIDQICSFLNLDLDRDAMRKSVELKLYRQRRSELDSSGL